MGSTLVKVVDFATITPYISIMATGFLYDPRFLEHDTGQNHPESPERLKAVMAHLEGLPWFPDLVHIAPRMAEKEWLLKAHAEDYIQRAEEACQKGLKYLDSLDVAICPKSYEIALLACGGALELGDALMNERIQNGFGLLRPPGHHAEKSQAMGFCLFNNIAVLACYLQEKYALEKILILDWDVHHGNGTQHTFENDPTVFYVSLHQYPFYPGTGRTQEIGTGIGQGFTLNCPMSQGAGDFDYQTVFTDLVLPRVHEFQPDVILISSGFDAHAQDPLAGIQLTSGCYGWMTERMMEIANRYCQGRILSVLEGGYNLKALPACVEQHLLVLSGNQFL